MNVRAVLIGLLSGTWLAAAAMGEDQDRVLVKPDAFQTLVNPNCSHCVDEAKRRAEELRPNDRVLCWIRGKYDGGAIPYRFFLSPYRVISDTYGVFVYDADAGFVRGFEPSLDFSFYGWRNGVMAIRHKDGTVYSALSGRAFDGPGKGKRLKPVATLETDWGYWIKSYPNTVAYRMYEKYKPFDLPGKPTESSLQTRRPPDSRLAAEARILGLWTPTVARAYPDLAEAKQNRVVADQMEGRPLAVFVYSETGTAAAYWTAVEGTALTFRVDDSSPMAPFRDDQTGSHWDIAGRAVRGLLKGKTLDWIDGVQIKWFAWAAEHPGTEIRQAP